MGNGKSMPSDTVHDIINFLPLLKGPYKERDCARIHNKGTQPEQVRGDSCKFTTDHANILGSFRDLDICDLLYGCIESHIIQVGSQVVHAIGLGHKLLMVLVISILLHTMVLISD